MYEFSIGESKCMKLSVISFAYVVEKNTSVVSEVISARGVLEMVAKEHKSRQLGRIPSGS